MYHENGYQITHHICPRNCYDSCPMLAYSKNGHIEQLTGDHSAGSHFSKLCSKHTHILETVYHPDRLLYPMQQQGRGTGNWQRISWDTAMDIIARKILSLKEQYHSTLPLCLNKYSGNFGLLHFAVEGMFNSLGATTQTTGTPCFSSGLDAQYLDFGGNVTSDIHELLHARLIILWGVNPAWTSVHSMTTLYTAQKHGAKIVVIDPVCTETAHKADYYIQLRPGSDAALATLLLQALDHRGILKADNARISGQQELLAAVRAQDPQRLLAAVDQPQQTIDFLAELIAAQTPMHIWCGFGLQRHVQGGLTIRLIDAMSILTGNIGIPGGGVNFADRGMETLFPYHIMQNRTDNRLVNINDFAGTLQRLNTPPVRLLWVACRDLLRQDIALQQLRDVWSSLEFIVVADKFLTKTAEMADIVLPVTTEFEGLDVYGGYFHHHLGINEPAIPPRGEARSDIEIARLLTRCLNELSPGSSSFPSELSDEDLLDREFTAEVCQQLGISGWRELTQHPTLYRRESVAWKGQQFATDDGNFHCCELPEAFAHLLPSAEYPFHLLTPHYQQHINGQSHTSRQELPEYPCVCIHPNAAQKLGLSEDKPAILWNDLGKLTVSIQYNSDLAPDVLMSPQGCSRQGGLNLLTHGHLTDLGTKKTGAPGVAFFDVFVNIRAVT